MKVKNLITIIFLNFVLFSKVSAQSYDFTPITQMLNDSSALYLNRIYVEVFQNDTSIYQYQAGWLNCNNVRLGQGSATKWISGAIMLRLAEKGYWSFNDSIGKFLPVFTTYGKGHITLRQSYSMSSGMFNSGTQPQKYHTNSSLTLAQSVDSIAINVPIEYATGSMIGYDGTMMHAWGRVAEVVDSIKGHNRDWRTIAKEEFFDLMEMDSTDYTDFLPNPAIAGGIETTPCDYLKFLKMLSNNGIYNGDTILQQSSIDEMFIDQTNSAPIYHTYWPHNHPDFPATVDTMRYTFGAWWSELDNFGNIIQITSPGVYGHFPFIDRCRNLYGTFFCYIPPIQGGGAVVENTFLHFMKILRDTIGSSCNLSTEVDETTLPGNINIYPNPSNDLVYINADKNIKHIIIYNSFGLAVRVLEIENNETELSIGNLSPGIYFLHAKYSNNQVITSKLIKQ